MRKGHLFLFLIFFFMLFNFLFHSSPVMRGGRSKNIQARGKVRKDVCVSKTWIGTPGLVMQGGKFKRRIARGCKQSAGKEFRVVSLSDVTHGATTIIRPELMMLSEARSVKL